MVLRSKIAVGGIAIVVAVVGGAIASASPDGREGNTDRTKSDVLRFGVAFSSLNIVDVGPKGLTPGDLITSHDQLFTRAGKRVGHEGVACTIESVNNPVEAVCQVIFRVPGGTITAQFFSIAGPAQKRGAITGGTGRYRLARGHFTLIESGQDQNIEGNKLVLYVEDVLR